MNNTNFGIVKTFDESDFINEFKAYNRMDNFSYKGLRILFESLEQMAQDCEMVIEMDVIGLCCEYSELSVNDVISEYQLDDDADVIDYLHNHTMVLGSYDINGVDYILFQSF